MASAERQNSWFAKRLLMSDTLATGVCEAVARVMSLFSWKKNSGKDQWQLLEPVFLDQAPRNWARRLVFLTRRSTFIYRHISSQISMVC